VYVFETIDLSIYIHISRSSTHYTHTPPTKLTVLMNLGGTTIMASSSLDTSSFERKFMVL
jgi:hypothetical protein